MVIIRKSIRNHSSFLKTSTGLFVVGKLADLGFSLAVMVGLHFESTREDNYTRCICKIRILTWQWAVWWEQEW